MLFLSLRRAGLWLGLMLVAGTGLLRAQTYGLSSRPSLGAYFDNAFPPEPPAIATNWSTAVAFPNLTFTNPLGLAPIPGTNKLVVWEREGKVWAFDNDPTVSTKTLVLDLSSQCQGWDDSGLLGLAFHPDFAKNHKVFVWYVWRGGLLNGLGDLGAILGSALTRPPTDMDVRSRLSCFTLDSNFQASLANEDVYVDQKKYTIWHNGGGMFFGPQDGFLYLGTGADSDSFTQQIDIGFFSSLLRIDVDQRGGDISHPPLRQAYNEVSPNWPRYYIPNNNPFVGVDNALEEIYALGLRNPHRACVDPVTNRIFIGDVGGSEYEEVDTIDPSDPPGLNFQWDKLEGGGADIPAPLIGTNKQPLYSYHHGGDGTCIIGGMVYRGSDFPELRGKYIFGDNVSNFIWYLDESTSPASKVLLATLPKGPGPNTGSDYTGLSSFGTDANGEIYMCQLSSTAAKIYKLHGGGAAATTPLPATLSATGLFIDLASLTPSPKLLPYDINLPFWSDHAIKSRFMAIPSDGTVAFRSTGEWNFPPGSIFVKHFDFPLSTTDPTQRRRLETRVLVKKDDGTVYGATYKWRADQSDADLLDGSLTEPLAIDTGAPANYTGDDIGGPALAGSTTQDGNVLTLKGAGADLWGTVDQCQFAHQTWTGDFDISTRVISVSPTQVATKAGLMVRQDLSPGSSYVMAMVYPYDAVRTSYTGSYGFQYRNLMNGGTTDVPPAVSPQPGVDYPNTWLRLKRQGDTFVSYCSQDGFTWTEYARQTVIMSSQVQVGPALTSHLATQLATASFEVGVLKQDWYYPGRQDCVLCHNAQAGGLLGFNARQTNRDATFPNGVVANQLRTWNHIGLFSDGPADAEVDAIQKLYAPTDTSVDLQTRARSYLDANCASCHRPGGAQAYWDARLATDFDKQGIRYGELVNDLNNDDSRVITPQSLANSAIYQRTSIVGANQMPPLARAQIDSAGVALLSKWIQSMQPDVLAKIQISGNGVVISPEDFSPDLGNLTDFGAATPGADTVTRTFSVKNVGNGTLTFNGTPHITLSGVDASSFSITAQPADNLVPGAVSSFQILFNPLTTGTKTAFVTVRSNDANDSSKVFAIRGTATQHKLVAWWKLDEASGSTLAIDSTGNGRTGVLTAPNPTWTVGERSDGSLRFTGEVNQSVTVQNHASLNPTAAITVTAWVKALDWNSNRRIVQKGDTDNQYRLLAENGKLVWEIAGAGRLETNLPAINTWFHIAATYEGRTFRIYINGTLTATKIQSGVIPVTTSSLYLGTKIPGAVAGDHLNGYLDEVRIYSNALSAAEITQLAQQSGVVSIEATDSVAQKGTDNTGTFTITRAGRTTSALPINLSLVAGDGQARQTTDFVFTPALNALSIPAGETSTTLTVTPVNSTAVTGTLNVTASLADGTGYTVGANPSAKVQLLDSVWNQWKVGAFGSLAQAASPAGLDTADADGDGLSTVAEAALGGNPLVRDSKLLPDAQVEYVDDGFYLTSTYTRITPLPDGVSLLSSTALDLAGSSWQPAIMVGGYPINNYDGTETVKVRSLLQVSASRSQFIRLEITKP